MGTGGSVAVNTRLGAIAGRTPAIAGEALAHGRDAALDLLREIAPLDTGLLQSEIYGRSNQYTAEVISPVYYTLYQEFGFFNVLARRWIPGRYFMMEAGLEMERAATERLLQLLGAM